VGDPDLAAGGGHDHGVVGAGSRHRDLLWGR
jgi:hypothetical protein